MNNEGENLITWNSMPDMTTIILHDTKITVENAQENKIWIFRNLKVWFGTKEITAYE